MPIHPSGYRPYGGGMASPATRWLVLARNEVAKAFRSRKMLALYFFCVAPALLSLGALYVRYVLLPVALQRAPRPGRAAEGPFPLEVFDPLKPEFYLNPILRSSFVLFVAWSVVVASQTVARDRKAGALEILLTRSLAPWGYLVGKWTGVACLFALLFLVPMLGLWLAAVFLSPEWEVLEKTASFMPGAAAGIAFLCAFLALLAVAVSACTDSPAFAAIAWVVLLVVPATISAILADLFGAGWWQALSPWHAATSVVEWIAGLRSHQGPSFRHAAVSVALLIAAAFLSMVRRLRAVEVVR